MIDVEWHGLHFARGFADALEFVVTDVAAPDLVGRNAGLFGDDTCRELFGRHFEREEAHDAAVDGLMGAIRPHARFIGTRNVERDVGG